MQGTMTPCAACATPFECLPDNIRTCGCYAIVLPDAAKAWIAQNYHGCLCTECLLKIKEQFEVTS